MSLDLKPCAHCGGEGVFGYVDDKDSPDHGGHFVQCVEMRCGASVGLIYNNGEDPKPLLSERWNRRTPDPAITAERDGLREALGRLSVYMIEDDDRVHLTVEGVHLEGFQQHSPEAMALLRLDALLRALSLQGGER